MLYYHIVNQTVIEVAYYRDTLFYNKYDLSSVRVIFIPTQVTHVLNMSLSDILWMTILTGYEWIDHKNSQRF